MSGFLNVCRRVRAMLRAFIFLPETLRCIMATQADLVASVADLKDSVKALEDKIPTDGGGVVDQATLDAVVLEINDAITRIDAETAKK